MHEDLRRTIISNLEYHFNFKIASPSNLNKATANMPMMRIEREPEEMDYELALEQSAVMSVTTLENPLKRGYDESDGPVDQGKRIKLEDGTCAPTVQEVTQLPSPPKTPEVKYKPLKSEPSLRYPAFKPIKKRAPGSRKYDQRPPDLAADLGHRGAKYEFKRKYKACKKKLDKDGLPIPPHIPLPYNARQTCTEDEKSYFRKKAGVFLVKEREYHVAKMERHWKTHPKRQKWNKVPKMEVLPAKDWKFYQVGQLHDPSPLRWTHTPEDMPEEPELDSDVETQCGEDFSSPETERGDGADTKGRYKTLLRRQFEEWNKPYEANVIWGATEGELSWDEYYTELSEWEKLLADEEAELEKVFDDEFEQAFEAIEELEKTERCIEEGIQSPWTQKQPKTIEELEEMKRCIEEGIRGAWTPGKCGLAYGYIRLESTGYTGVASTETERCVEEGTRGSWTAGRSGIAYGSY